VALTGGLGAGKTTLARAIIAALGHAGEVPSPSFAIIETLRSPGVRLPVVHADFYRLDDPREEWRNWGWTITARARCCWPNGPNRPAASRMKPGASRLLLETAEEGRRIAIVEGGRIG
jgi:tRNA threonylcarbamoyladenosine biosynthesis protein TsaE